ncbi:uncharacterized protein LOC124933587 [Impatiens glandulifera]|uniref:uncharacterized protein LOC124933587 n=1 Tax=Impatiens glandulifera TaxID=253017 RepID=UPI001FB189CA|nr:uncharacterized protein LOC124933587 [Impatiens glandulifera]
MDALWKVEDKTKISTVGAVVVFACIIFLLIILLTVILLLAKLKRRRRPADNQPEPEPAAECNPVVPPPLNQTNSGEVRQSHNSSSPWPPVLWQRPILMGEKCELPRFSGLILYDQRGTLAATSRSS